MGMSSIEVFLRARRPLRHRRLGPFHTRGTKEAVELLFDNLARTRRQMCRGIRAKNGTNQTILETNNSTNTYRLLLLASLEAGLDSTGAFGASKAVWLEVAEEDGVYGDMAKDVGLKAIQQAGRASDLQPAAISTLCSHSESVSSALEKSPCHSRSPKRDRSCQKCDTELGVRIIKPMLHVIVTPTRHVWLPSLVSVQPISVWR